MPVQFGRYEPVTIIRARGRPHEQRWDVHAGGNIDTNALFQADVDIKRGDEIHAEGLDEPRVVAAVHPKRTFSGLSHHEVELVPLSVHSEQARRQDLLASLLPEQSPADTHDGPADVTPAHLRTCDKISVAT